MPRTFYYESKPYEDPDPSMSVDEVRQSMANFFPELSNAESEIKKDGDNEKITFKKSVGTKG